MKKQYISFIQRTYKSIFGSPSCGAEVLVATDFDGCDPEIRLSEIRRIFVCKIGGVDFTDWTERTEWDARISADNTEQNAIRAITVIGNKPLPNRTKKSISNSRTVTTRKDHVVNATIDEVTTINHTFIQDISSGKKFRLWYETMGGLLFGGNSGIICHLSGEMVLARGAGEIMLYELTAEWENKRTEDRCESPIYTDAPAVDPGGPPYDTTIDFDVTFFHDMEGGRMTFVSTPAGGPPSGSVDPNISISYNSITPIPGGIAANMAIRVGGVQELFVYAVPIYYVGTQFEFTDSTGAVHIGLFASPIVDF